MLFTAQSHWTFSRGGTCLTAVARRALMMRRGTCCQSERQWEAAVHAAAILSELSKAVKLAEEAGAGGATGVGQWHKG